MSPAAIVQPCYLGCPKPVSNKHRSEFKAALLEANSSEYCVCVGKPWDCKTWGQLGCVAGRCQFL